MPRASAALGPTLPRRDFLPSLPLPLPSLSSFGSGHLNVAPGLDRVAARRRGAEVDIVARAHAAERGRGRRAAAGAAGRLVATRSWCHPRAARARRRAQELGEAAVDDDDVHQARDHHRHDEEGEAEHLEERERRVRLGGVGVPSRAP